MGKSGAEKRRRRKASKKRDDMEQPPTIYMLVHHHLPLPGVDHALYKIQLPLDLSDYDHMIDSDGFMTDSKNISPVLTFIETNFLPLYTSVTLGSKIYFFGGRINNVKDRRLYCKVQVFDTQHPEQGMQTVAPLNFPKQRPCVFVAHGMIYSLGSYIGRTGSEKRLFPGCKGTGHFERYDPSLDQWQVLSDPPLSDSEWALSDFSDCATVVGHQVFIGNPYLCAIFNLNDQDWEPIPPPLRRRRFYCASIFVQDSASLYYLRRPEKYLDPVKVFKKGLLRTPTGTTEQSDSGRNLLNIPCLDFGEQQVVAQGTDLEDSFFAHCNFNPYRNLLHMGGRFFCYVVSAQLADHFDRTHFEPNSRGVWIKILEVPTETHDGNSNVKLRTLASFCYKIDTDFANRAWACHIRCSVLGTVPDSWIKAPLEKKLSIKLKHKSERSKALQIQSLVTPTEQEVCKAEQKRHEVENAEKKLITVEQENSRLVAELAKKEELVKMYEILLEKSLSMLNVNSEKKKSEAGGCGYGGLFKL